MSGFVSNGVAMCRQYVLQKLVAAGWDSDLDPQLVWRGKDEQDWSDLVVHAPPLFIQEKVAPKTLIDDLLRQSNADRLAREVLERAEKGQLGPQADLFADFNGIPVGADRTDFYQHDQNWTNRLILGDSLQVMASLAEREGLRGRVQCIYLDPPYGIKFNSNFQWSTTSRDVKDGNAGHFTREPEQVKAFRDTWRDGIHSYLTYLRDRLTVARDLLTESGSIFVQIGDENVHRVRAALDLETTGLDHATDAIIQISLVRFTYDKRSGTIYKADEPLTFFEDPGRPIPPQVTELTGITDADVAGKRIDDELVESLIASLSLIVAHNAAFDRPFAERRFASLERKHWACSINDVPWKPAGMSSAKLEYLLIKHCNCNYGAHRADNDCNALIHLLATPFADGSLPMSLLLESARSRTVRVSARGAAFEKKDLLKSRGYRWHAGSDGNEKHWYRDVREKEGDAEKQWLRDNVFGGIPVDPPTTIFTALDRYSHRV